MFWKISPRPALSVPEPGENGSRVNVPEFRQMRYQTGRQDGDNQDIGEGRLQWNHNPGQK